MRSKAFLWAGWLALGLIFVTSAAALAVVKDRVTVVVSPSDGTREGEKLTASVSLLSEDLRLMQADLRALSERTGTALQGLSDEFDRSAQSQADSLQKEAVALREAIAALDRRVTALAGAESQARLAEAVQQIGAGLKDALATRSEREAALAKSLEALQREAQERAELARLDAPASGSSAAEPLPERGSSPPALPVTSGKRFLTFQLPSQSFDLEKAQRFVILESASRVGFDAKSTLHDFSGACTKVRGELKACLGRPEEDCEGEIFAEAAALQTGLDDRDLEMRKHLDTAQHPNIRFEWLGFEPKSIEARGSKFAGDAKGKLTIRGVSREFVIPVQVSTDASHRLSISGQAKVRLPDYGVPVPSKLGLISMDEEVQIWLELRARWAGAAEPREAARAR
ncbi:MAG: YceI family protein [Planctomycetes bacterium]|nr:YceI family protein [Planctomycetota bacterium]